MAASRLAAPRQPDPRREWPGPGGRLPGIEWQPGGRRPERGEWPPIGEGQPGREGPGPGGRPPGREWPTPAERPPGRGLRRGAGGHAASGGRWSLLPGVGPVDDRDALAEAVAEQLLARWGVVLREVLARETLALPWRDVLWALRRLEARGVVRGGRFVTGFSGEQYALPEAVEQLRAVRRERRTGEVVRVPATDPVNLVGILTPGPRIPAVRTNTVTYVDGLPVTDAAGGAAGAGAGRPA